jgi:ATP-dependent Lon protease
MTKGDKETKSKKGEVDEVEFRKFLASVFPSDYANEKVAQAEKAKRKRTKDVAADDNTQATTVPTSKAKLARTEVGAWKVVDGKLQNIPLPSSSQSDSKSDIKADSGKDEALALREKRQKAISNLAGANKMFDNAIKDLISASEKIKASNTKTRSNKEEPEKPDLMCESDAELPSDDDESYHSEEETSDEEYLPDDSEVTEMDDQAEVDNDNRSCDEADVSIDDGEDIGDSSSEYMTSDREEYAEMSARPVRRSRRIAVRKQNTANFANQALNGTDVIDEDDDEMENDSGDEKQSDNTTVSMNSDNETLSDERTSQISSLSHDSMFTATVEDIPDPLKPRCKKHWDRFKMKLEEEKKRYVAAKKKRDMQTRRGNLSKFKKLSMDGSRMNDIKYFNRVMSLEEQQKVLAQLDELKPFSSPDKPYRMRVLEAPIPPSVKANALKKVNMLNGCASTDGEYMKLKKWIDSFLQIPFGKHSELSISLADGHEKCCQFMRDAQKSLDHAVHGLDDAKLQIIQMLGQWISNPSALGSSVAIHGPMGTGKTTLVKNGISKILGREFVFIALGGATDSSFLEGHSYTYEGSTWGKIVDSLMQCKTMNPIIYFDELDKVSETPKGEEIIGILTHLIDTSQNDRFQDKYFSEIELDLSKCMFIFSYNDPKLVNPILRDRMYTIKTNGYTTAEKVTIATEHLLPSIISQVGFKPEEITFSDEILTQIVKDYTPKDEKGVREFKRALEIIVTKLNLYRLLEPGSEMFGQKIPNDVSFPVSVNEELVKRLLKKEEEENKHWVMYT